MFYKKKYKLAKAKLNLLAHKHVFDVEWFNIWFCAEGKDKDIYAHAGIFGRTDKLSRHQIIHYFHTLTDELTLDELEYMYEEFFFLTLNFEDKIKRNWMYNE